MSIKSGQAWAGLVVCRDATGAIAAPASTPVAALYVNGVVNAASVTVTGSNPYKWAVTLPTLAAGDTVSMYLTATIASIATASVVAEDVADTKRVSDLNDAESAEGIVEAIEDGLAAIANAGTTVTIQNVVNGGTITEHQADTWRFTVNDAALNLADYEAVALVVKKDELQADADAILYLRSDTGLMRIDGAAPIAAGNGTLTKTATSFTGVVAMAETVGVDVGSWQWWLKGFDTTPNPDEGFTLATGTFVVTAAGLRAIT